MISSSESRLEIDTVESNDREKGLKAHCRPYIAHYASFTYEKSTDISAMAVSYNPRRSEAFDNPLSSYTWSLLILLNSLLSLIKIAINALINSSRSESVMQE